MKELYFVSAVLLLSCCLAVGRGSAVINCKLVVCKQPEECFQPIPAQPHKGICCPQCPPTPYPVDLDSCPPSKPIVNCFVNPCRFATCKAHPDAKCEDDYCGGCNARFFDDQDNEITDSCNCPVQGQIFTLCGSACPANCTDPTPICTEQCVARCECTQGTVIDQLTNTCVPVEECSADGSGGFDDPGINGNKECPPGQVFNFCGSACTATCEDPNPICTLQCVSRCECRNDKVLDIDSGKCIPESRCKKLQGSAGKQDSYR